MEGKNLEAVKNTADNFKSILPKDKLSDKTLKILQNHYLK